MRENLKDGRPSHIQILSISSSRIGMMVGLFVDQADITVNFIYPWISVKVTKDRMIPCPVYISFNHCVV